MRTGARLAAATVAACGILAAPAAAAVTHTIQPGETLSGIAAANGLTTDALASWNGVSSDYLVIAGNTLAVPTPGEAGIGTTTATAAPAPAVAPAPWLGAIPSPWGDLYLDAGAAAAWNSMRQQALSDYGVDLYPAGPMSAYRTSTQQGDLYEMFLSGVGAPANPPGYSSHELGVSVDVATPEMRDVVDQIGYLYGWGKTEAPTEWWHVTWSG
ncbi:MAG: LysM peptidoglycan-binding domain-containing protein [Solirubrobacterales bacterium]|nr:LysM peptidoglycan-binding domain-containing protein [Solirubrobacterales bacterium]